MTKPITKPTPKIDPATLDEAPYRDSHVPGVKPGTAIRLASFRALDAIGVIGVEAIGMIGTETLERVRLCIAKSEIPLFVAALEAHAKASPEDPT